MIRRSNIKNNNHILTPNERLFYQRIAIEGTQQIIAQRNSGFRGFR